MMPRSPEGRGPLLLVIGLGVVGGTLACDTSTGLPRDVDPLIQTDRLAYELQFDGVGLTTEIPYVYENRTGASVYLVNCNGAFALRLERREGGEWISAWGPVLNLCLSPPIVIAAGATFADTLRVWGAMPGQNWYPQFDVPDPMGTYRILWIDALSSFQDRLPFGEQIPLEYRVSNQFLLTVR